MNPLIRRACAWLAGQDWNPVRRTRKAWAASEWSRMTPRTRAANLVGWALFIFCALVVLGVYVCALKTWPRWTKVGTLAAFFAAAWHCVGFRNGDHAGSAIRDQLDYAQQRWDMVNNSEAREDLSRIGPITDPTRVVDIEPPEWVTNPPYLADEVSA